MVRKRRATTRAIRHNLISLEKQILIPEVFQDRPDRFHIFIGIGYIGIFQVNPKSDAVCESFPILNIGKN